MILLAKFYRLAISTVATSLAWPYRCFSFPDPPKGSGLAICEASLVLACGVWGRDYTIVSTCSNYKGSGEREQSNFIGRHHWISA